MPRRLADSEPRTSSLPKVRGVHARSDIHGLLLGERDRDPRTPRSSDRRVGGLGDLRLSDLTSMVRPGGRLAPSMGKSPTGHTCRSQGSKPLTSSSSLAHAFESARPLRIITLRVLGEPVIAGLIMRPGPRSSCFAAFPRSFTLRRTPDSVLVRRPSASACF